MSDAPSVVTGGLLREWGLPTPEGEGKGARGTVVVIGGAHHTPGAVLLAGVAALRVGAGRLTMATVERNAPSLAVAVPEAGVVALPATEDGSLGEAAVQAATELVEGADAVVIGPGMAGPDHARDLVSALLPAIGPDTTLVLDALGLTCGALDATTGRRLGGRVIVTPNRAEADRLLGDAPDGGDRREQDGEPSGDLRATRRLTELTGAVVALRSTVVSPEGAAWVDGSGNAGLGTSGSGDVLAGAIAGLAARGASPDQATVWGVHLHAEAGERLAVRVGALGFLARELLDELPGVLDQLSR
jgi:hydroxyethylthiazole kinase-like uncharacterized protein yjeF